MFLSFLLDGGPIVIIDSISYDKKKKHCFIIWWLACSEPSSYPLAKKKRMQTPSRCVGETLFYNVMAGLQWPSSNPALWLVNLTCTLCLASGQSQSPSAKYALIVYTPFTDAVFISINHDRFKKVCQTKIMFLFSTKKVFFWRCCCGCAENTSDTWL